MLSSRTVDSHQMYFGGSVIGKASTIGIGISPTPPLIFTGGQKVRNLALFETSLNFEPLTYENAAGYPNSETKVQCCDDRPMSWPSMVKLVMHVLCITVLFADCMKTLFYLKVTENLISFMHTVTSVFTACKLLQYGIRHRKIWRK